ncbi:type VI secretion system baseplate subunit TssF [Parashewanella tropica]|uniref:type VI secretion system baseplate subunit TssF n=1 Tax=Parashewanella tropica TaxID=2547970 RepID=UPI0014783567|nr:type VI secretion system baseplate subunit TssF [Parashewanella tropica]
MPDSLLSYFEQELRFIREESVEFAQKNPGSATTLGISNSGIEDPELSRLVESMALLNAKLHKRLDDTYPEFTQSLINIIFPHVLRPIPSYSVLEFLVDESAKATHHVPVHTEFDIGKKENEATIFRTTEPVTLYPIKLADAKVTFAPFEHVKPKGAEQATALLELTIEAIDDGIAINELNIDKLKLQLKGETNLSLRLYDLLRRSTLAICITSDNDRFPVDKNTMSTVGYDLNHTVLPYNANTFSGYRLLTEFFMFPDSFTAFTFHLQQALAKVSNHHFTIQLYLAEFDVELARNLTLDFFSLFSTPIINLHEMMAEPLEINFLKKQYPLVIDSMRSRSYELYSINRITDVTNTPSFDVPQIFREKFNTEPTGLRWQLLQQISSHTSTENSIKVSDLSDYSISDEVRIWLVNITVTQSRKASHQSINSQIQCRDTLTIPGKLQLAKRPSSVLKHHEDSDRIWTLLNHLQFNIQSTLGTENPCKALKDIFHFYNLNNNTQNKKYIDALSEIEMEHVIATIMTSGKSCFTYGTHITVVLNTTQLTSGVTLFAQFLDSFFSNFVMFNSFTQLDIKLEGYDEIYMSFPRRTGCKTLI